MEKEKIRKIKFRETLKIEFEVMPISNIFKRFQKGNIEFNIGQFHRPQFNMILLVKSDGAKHFVDFKMYDLNKNDILLVGNNHVHAFSADQNLEGTAIIFTNNFIEIDKIGMISFKNLFNIHVIKKLGEDSTIKELFNILNNEYNRDNYDSIMLYRYLLRSILTKLDLLVDKYEMIKNNNEYIKIVLNIDRLIEKFNYQSRNSTKYIEVVGYSYKQLNIICKSVTGYTLKNYIDSVIILEMKRQIVANSMSLKELCVFFDFDEETNLLKFFKRNVGISPKKFGDKYKNFQK